MSKIIGTEEVRTEKNNKWNIASNEGVILLEHQPRDLFIPLIQTTDIID